MAKVLGQKDYRGEKSLMGEEGKISGERMRRLDQKVLLHCQFKDMDSSCWFINKSNIVNKRNVA